MNYLPESLVLLGVESSHLPFLSPSSDSQTNKGLVFPKGRAWVKQTKHLGLKKLKNCWLSGANPELAGPESQHLLKFLSLRCLTCLPRVLALLS